MSINVWTFSELCVAKYPLTMPSLLIFQYPITIVILLAVAFIVIFLLLALYFYSDDLVSFLKFNNNASNSKSSVKYKKLSSSISLSDNSDNDSGDEYQSSVDKIQFKKSAISSSKSMNLEVIDVEKSSDVHNEYRSLSRPTSQNNLVNGHVKSWFHENQSISYFPIISEYIFHFCIISFIGMLIYFVRVVCFSLYLVPTIYDNNLSFVIVN